MSPPIARRRRQAHRPDPSSLFDEPLPKWIRPCLSGLGPVRACLPTGGKELGRQINLNHRISASLAFERERSAMKYILDISGHDEHRRTPALNISADCSHPSMLQWRTAKLAIKNWPILV